LCGAALPVQQSIDVLSRRLVTPVARGSIPELFDL
jgi:hypothetical protein